MPCGLRHVVFVFIHVCCRQGPPGGTVSNLTDQEHQQKSRLAKSKAILETSNEWSRSDDHITRIWRNYWYCIRSVRFFLSVFDSHFSSCIFWERFVVSLVFGHHFLRFPTHLQEMIDHVEMLVEHLTNDDPKKRIKAAEAMSAYIADHAFLPEKMDVHPAQVLASLFFRTVPDRSLVWVSFGCLVFVCFWPGQNHDSNESFCHRSFFERMSEHVLLLSEKYCWSPLLKSVRDLHTYPKLPS